MKRPVSLSTEVRAARSALMQRLNADVSFQKRRHAGMAAAREKRNARVLSKPQSPIKDRVFGNVRPHPVPTNTTPLVRGLFIEMNDQRATIRDVTSRAGISYDTLRFWNRNMPRVDLLDAALNALDLELAIVPIGTRDANGFVLNKTPSRR